jgi:2-C-methyl-D-erythritol 4-phosphate cytidylyltransferase
MVVEGPFMKIAVILPAAGTGSRFIQAAGPSSSLPQNKLEIDLGGRPVFLRAIERFLKRPGVEQIILAVNPDTIDEFKFRWGDKLGFHGVQVVPGGKAERWETVLKALDAVKPGCTHAAIHDAARPLTSGKLIDRTFEAAQTHAAVIPGLPVSATLKRVGPVETKEEKDPLDAILGATGKPRLEVRKVLATVDRRDAVEIQTPQVFELALLRRAYAQITSGQLKGEGITDDAGLVEALGEPVYVVEGEVTNLKITRPDDLSLALAYVQANAQQEAKDLAKKRLFADEDE